MGEEGVAVDDPVCEGQSTAAGYKIKYDDKIKNNIWLVSAFRTLDF